MLRVNHISFTFEDNGSLHDDLALRLGDCIWRVDSYLLWCEDPREDSATEVVKERLSMLVQQWINAIRKLNVGQSCFLPFDFSDECTQWLRCTLDGDSVSIRMGWSNTEGWSIAPSNIGHLLNDVPDFKPIEFAAQINRDAMVRSLIS